MLCEHDLNSASGEESKHSVVEVKVHADHDEASYQNDIALFKISSCATVRQYIEI